MTLLANGSPVTAMRADGNAVDELRIDGEVVFRPTIRTIDTPVFHYDADDLRFDEGESVDEWENIAAEDDSIAPDAHQPSSADRPEYTESGIGGRPSVVFDGEAVLPVGMFDAPLEQPYTFAAVARADVAEAGYLFAGADNAYRSILSFDYHSDFRYWAGRSPALRTPSTTNAHVFICIADGAHSMLRVDTVSITGDAGDLRHDGLTIGGRGDGRRRFIGAIGELRGYDFRLNPTERALLANELAADWNLGLTYER